MRNWGILITLFYGVVLVFLLAPLGFLLAGWGWTRLEAPGGDIEMYMWVLILLIGQGLLLFVSIDTAFRHRRPRAHILVSISTTALMVALLTGGVVASITTAVWGDDAGGIFWYWMWHWDVPIISWVVWSIVFYFYKAGHSDKLNALVGWLLKGSVLELLVAIPCHIIVRQRDDCTAPVVTGFGIATGIAVMLMAFGPSVIFLYQKRLQQYKRKESPASG